MRKDQAKREDQIKKEGSRKKEGKIQNKEKRGKILEGKIEDPAGEQRRRHYKREASSKPAVQSRTRVRRRRILLRKEIFA